jgi:hypothetical protein
MEQIAVSQEQNDSINSNGKFDTNGWVVFCLIWMILCILAFMQKKYIFTEDVMFNTWSQQLAYEKVEELMAQKDKWPWVRYIIVPIMMLVQVSFVAFCLTIRELMTNTKTSFQCFFGVSIRAYPVLLMNGIVVILIAMVFVDVRTMQDFQNIDYFSLASIFKSDDMAQWYMYPLKTMNVFEALFWLALADGLRKQTGQTFGSCLSFVAFSYGIGLLFWVLFIMFLQLNLS